MERRSSHDWNLVDWNRVITGIQKAEGISLVQMSSALGLAKSGCAQIRNHHTNPRFATGAAIINWYQSTCSKKIPLLNGRYIEGFQ